MMLETMYQLNMKNILRKKFNFKKEKRFLYTRQMVLETANQSNIRILKYFEKVSIL